MNKSSETSTTSKIDSTLPEITYQPSNIQRILSLPLIPTSNALKLVRFLYEQDLATHKRYIKKYLESSTRQSFKLGFPQYDIEDELNTFGHKATLTKEPYSTFPKSSLLAESLERKLARLEQAVKLLNELGSAEIDCITREYINLCNFIFKNIKRFSRFDSLSTQRKE